MQSFLVRQHGRWGASETGADCGERGEKKKKKNPSVRSKSDSSHRKRAETTERNATPDPLASTPTHTVFVGCSDNNGSWRSCDRRLKTLTASCYVMNVWLPLSQRHTNMVLPTSHVLRQNRAMCPTETESCAWNLLFLFISMQLATCKHILQNQVSFSVKFCSVSLLQSWKDSVHKPLHCHL